MIWRRINEPRGVKRMTLYRPLAFPFLLFSTFFMAETAAASDGVPAAFDEDQMFAAQEGFESVWSPPGDPDGVIIKMAHRMSESEVEHALEEIKTPGDGVWSVDKMQKAGRALGLLWIKGGADVMRRLRDFYTAHDRLGEWFPGPDSLFRSDPGAAAPSGMEAATAGLSGDYCDEKKIGAPPGKLGNVRLEGLRDEIMAALFTNGLLCLDLPGVLYDLESRRVWKRRKDRWVVSDLSSTPDRGAVVSVRTLSVSKAGDEAFARLSVTVKGWKSIYRARLSKEGSWRLVGLWNMTLF